MVARGLAEGWQDFDKKSVAETIGKGYEAGQHLGRWRLGGGRPRGGFTMRSSVHSLAALSCSARSIALLVSIAAQCTSLQVRAAELVPVLTDQAPLDLPTTFGSAGP